MQFWSWGSFKDKGISLRGCFFYNGIRIRKTQSGIEDAPPVASFSFAYGKACCIIVAAGKKCISIGPCRKMVVAQVKVYRCFTSIIGQCLFCIENNIFPAGKEPGSKFFFSSMSRGIFLYIRKNLFAYLQF